MADVRITGMPARYVQGPGALGQIAEHAGFLGSSALLVVDKVVESSVGDRIIDALTAGDIEASVIEYEGELTDRKIADLKARADGLAQRPAFVLGAGGGKAVDAGKIIASHFGVPSVIVPTIASTDAPTSILSVIYDEEGRYLRCKHHDFNPAIVLVDTEVIANAPSRFLAAGMGDAISKKFEVSLAVATGKKNFHRAAAPFFITQLAEYAHDTILRYGVAAKQAVDERRVTEDLERVVEAVILASGMSFENGGMVGAHGLSDIMRTHGFGRDLMHGEMVGLMTLLQMRLMAVRSEDVEAVRELCSSVGLPTSVAAIGLPVDAAALGPIARDIHEKIAARTLDCTTDAIIQAIIETM